MEKEILNNDGKSYIAHFDKLQKLRDDAEGNANSLLIENIGHYRNFNIALATISLVAIAAVLQVASTPNQNIFKIFSLVWTGVGLLAVSSLVNILYLTYLIANENHGLIEKKNFYLTTFEAEIKNASDFIQRKELFSEYEKSYIENGLKYAQREQDMRQLSLIDKSDNTIRWIITLTFILGLIVIGASFFEINLNFLNSYIFWLGAVSIILLFGILIVFNFFKNMYKKRQFPILVYVIFTILFAGSLLSVILIIHRYSTTQNWGSRLDLIEMIATLLFAAVTGGLAFWQYSEYLKDKEKQKLENSKHVLQSIKPQLRDAGWWVTGNPQLYKSIHDVFKLEYKPTWKIKNFLKLINPSNSVSPINYSFINNINLLPGIVNLEKIYELVSGYVLWADQFNTKLILINKFIFSRKIEENIILIDKLNKIQESNPNIVPTDVEKMLSPEENNFTRILYSMYEDLFFRIVGHKNSCLYHYDNELTKALEEKLQETNDRLNNL